MNATRIPYSANAAPSSFLKKSRTVLTIRTSRIVIILDAAGCNPKRDDAKVQAEKKAV
jgi:hypothetical protein